MIDVIVYFHGPQTNWSGKIAEIEIIARHKIPWLWVARLKAKSIIDGLNTGRCGYALLHDGELIEHLEATELALVPAPPR